MSYEILIFQTVTIFSDDDDLIGQDVTIIEVLYAWGEEAIIESKSRIEFVGVPTEEEVLLEITKVGNKLKERPDVNMTIPKKGQIM